MEGVYLLRTTICVTILLTTPFTTSVYIKMIKTLKNTKYEHFTNSTQYKCKSAYIIKKAVKFGVTGRIVGHFKQWHKEVVNNLLKTCN